MKFKFGTGSGYLPGASWQNDPINSYEDVACFKGHVYSLIDASVEGLYADGWFDDYGSAEINDMPAPIGFDYYIDKNITGLDPTINVLYG